MNEMYFHQGLTHAEIALWWATSMSVSNISEGVYNYITMDTMTLDKWLVSFPTRDRDTFIVAEWCLRDK